MRMNANQAQAAYGTPKMTVGRWIKSKKLNADADGYFAEEDFLVLNAERVKKPAPGRSTSKAPKKKTAPKKKATVRKKRMVKKKTAPKKKAASRRPKKITDRKRATAASKAAPKAPPKKSAPKKKAVVRKKRTTEKKLAAEAQARPTDEDLIEQARTLCREADDYTIVFVQRALKVGYNRAQRISTALKREIEALLGKGNVNTRQGIDLRKALANAEKAEMEVKIKMKDLISRELVSKVFRKIYAIDSTEWRGLGPRVAPDLMALCMIEDPAKELEISDLIEGQVFRTLVHVQRVINKFLEEVESEERAGDD